MGLDSLAMYLVTFGLLGFSFYRDRSKTLRALKKGVKAIEHIMPQLLTVLILVSVMLVLLDPEYISLVLGEDSGFVSVLVASVVGAVTLIPGFVAFPVARQLLENGAAVLPIAAFISSLMMVGIITLPMEIQYLGKRVALLRNALAFGFSLLAAFVVSWGVSLW